jgi:hypothetical protein
VIPTGSGRIKISKRGNTKVFGIGTGILDALKVLFITKRTGCKFITVDAYNQSIKFYENSGFRFLTEGATSQTRPMYFDLFPLTQQIGDLELLERPD